jgi:hypothetical protein
MTKRFQLTVNERRVEVRCEDGAPLLYVLRNDLSLNGPKGHRLGFATRPRAKRRVSRAVANTSKRWRTGTETEGPPAPAEGRSNGRVPIRTYADVGGSRSTAGTSPFHETMTACRDEKARPL